MPSLENCWLLFHCSHFAHQQGRAQTASFHYRGLKIDISGVRMLVGASWDDYKEKDKYFVWHLASLSSIKMMQNVTLQWEMTSECRRMMVQFSVRAAVPECCACVRLLRADVMLRAVLVEELCSALQCSAPRSCWKWILEILLRLGSVLDLFLNECSLFYCRILFLRLFVSSVLSNYSSHRTFL